MKERTDSKGTETDSLNSGRPGFPLLGMLEGVPLLLRLHHCTQDEEVGGFRLPAGVVSERPEEPLTPSLTASSSSESGEEGRVGVIPVSR